MSQNLIRWTKDKQVGCDAIHLGNLMLGRFIHGERWALYIASTESALWASEITTPVEMDCWTVSRRNNSLVNLDLEANGMRYVVDALGAHFIGNAHAQRIFNIGDQTFVLPGLPSIPTIPPITFKGL